MAALVFETVEVRPHPGASLPSPPTSLDGASVVRAELGRSLRADSPSGSIAGSPRLTLAWHVHQSVRPLQPRVLDRVPPTEGGLVCATVVRAGRPPEPVAPAGLAAWAQQWWLGPAVGPPRTIYLQTNAV